ncbi:ABC transporter ATP-binding protein [Enterococcus sp. BWB1-3]|uniref:ABC transporter ATP-binding protein n=1 Tax=unclassified Enterococcus TaxID=2608891 RepID=UPI00192140E0|nr:MULTISPECIES: ABC transporter ATP-binding protein [unclassified Enterococcus]MBL1228697.1 ABC transporter ATP-binding protein [Enterococcus sp. BWB1-3]MCB5953687.1 ABC transporter ATP-binding protein [Enterococcus sp. CWB-B31]
MIEFQEVSKKYGNQTVLTDNNLAIQDGEFFVLVGPSGSGKTTTLKMINRLIEPTEGDIYFDHKRIIDYDLKELRLRIGYVLQQIALFPNMTVAENIELIPEMKNWKKDERRQRTRELLEKVGLSPEEYMQRKPSELSGGEQQRIGILRAIAAKPDIILMDEPFSALDPISKSQLQLLIKELHKELSGTIIFVTHDMNEAMLLGDRICIMRDGAVIQVDKPDQIKKHPKNDFVAQFFKNDSLGLADYRVEDLAAMDLLEIITGTAGRSVTMETGLDEVVRRLAANEKLNLQLEENQQAQVTSQTIVAFLQQQLEAGEPLDD